MWVVGWQSRNFISVFLLANNSSNNVANAIYDIRSFPFIQISFSIFAEYHQTD